MSAMPQNPKLTIRTPITTAIMVLPSQFDEAFRIPRSMGPTYLQEGAGSRPREIRVRIQQKGVTGPITHQKWAESASQPWWRRRIEAVNAAGTTDAATGSDRAALLAHS